MHDPLVEWSNSGAQTELGNPQAQDALHTLQVGSWYSCQVSESGLTLDQYRMLCTCCWWARGTFARCQNRGSP